MKKIKKLLCKFGFHDFIRYTCLFGETFEYKHSNGLTDVHFIHDSMSTCVCSRCCEKGNPLKAERGQRILCVRREDAKATIEKIERDGCFRGGTVK